MKSNQNLAILFAFIFLETITYDSYPALQGSIALFFYSFLFYKSIVSVKYAIIYYVQFTLISFGEWSYVITETPNNFYGIRLFGISVNVLFLIFISIKLLNLKTIKSKLIWQNNKIFILIFIYLLILGLINVGRGVNYLDNYISNVFVYLPFLFFLAIVSILKESEIKRILKHTILITTLGMLLSYILQIKFEYANGYEYVLINAIGYILPFSIFLMSDLFNRKTHIALIAILVTLILTGELFLNGKLIVILVMTFVWFIIKNRNNIKNLVVILSLLFVSSTFVFQLIENDPIIKYKFSQVENALSSSGDIKQSEGSLSNIVAEFYCIKEHFKENYYFMIFGKGFGGGIPDKNGLLRQYAGEAGYKKIDGERNDFNTMHISLSEFLVKSGIFISMFFLYFLIKLISRTSIYSFLLFILFLTVFYTSKEMVLLTVLLLRYEYLIRFDKTKVYRMKKQSQPKHLI